MDGKDTIVRGLAVVGAATVAAGLFTLAKSTLQCQKNSQADAQLAAEVAARQDAQQEIESLKAAAAQTALQNQEAIASLESQLASAKSGDGESKADKKPIRVYIDGCFDMMHFGHSNALRQAAACGDKLIVGLMTDEEIYRQKGAPPVMNLKEREICVRGCKWVDDVILGAPYDVTREWTEELFTTYDIDFIVHGDDPCITADGKDAYATAKEWGRYKEIKRTEGVSTTDVVGRMLLHTREHHVHRDSSQAKRASEEAKKLAPSDTPASQFLPTTRRLQQFSSGKTPQPGDTVVYISGAFDMFHSGHIQALAEARKLGDFLLVGIHDDDIVNSKRGGCFPLMNLHERVLSVLSCRYVDEVIIGAPWVVTQDLLTTMNISIVAHGTRSDTQQLTQAQGATGDAVLDAAAEAEAEATAAAAGDDDAKDAPTDAAAATAADASAEAEAAAAAAAAAAAGKAEDDLCYAIPRQLGILREFASPGDLSARVIIGRILAKSDVYGARFAKKSAKDKEYVANKGFVAER